MNDKPYDWANEETDDWPELSTPKPAWLAHFNPLQLFRSRWWVRRS